MTVLLTEDSTEDMLRESEERPLLRDSTRTIGDLRPGDHLCCIYESEQEHRAVLVPFLRHGLERNEKVLYIVDARTAETILGYLRGDGPDVDAFLTSGQLGILTVDDAYMREGVFHPDGMIALLQAATEQALTEGYSALRVTGEMTWALRGLPGSERLIEYEAKLNEFFPNSQCLAICQYDRRRFDPTVLMDVLRTHPTAVVGTAVYSNFYYVPPAELLSGEFPATKLERWLQNLARRRRAEEALQESETRLRTLIQRNADGIVIVDRTGIVRFVNPAAETLFGREAEELLGELFGFPVIAGETTELDIIRSGGDTAVAEMRVVETEWEAEPAYLASLRDITARVQAEEEIRRRVAHQEALNAIIAAATAVSDLPDLLQIALDHTLHALGLEMGAIWVPGQHFLRGLPPEMGPASAQVAQVAGLDLASPIAVEDWQTARSEARSESGVPSDATPPAATWLTTNGLTTNELGTDELPAYGPLMARFGIRASLTVPILTEGRRIGGLSLASPDPRPWSAEEIALVEAVGRQLGGTAERLRLLQAEQTRRQELDALYTLSRQLAATDAVDRILNTIAQHTVATVHVTFCRVLILEDDRPVCRAAYPRRLLERDLGVGQPDPEPAWPHYRRALAQAEPRVLFQNTPELSPAEREALFLDPSPGSGQALAHSLCLVPLYVSDLAIGLLALGEARSEAREPFGPDKQRLVVAIADQAASAIHRARLHEETGRRLQHITALHEIDRAISSSLDLRITLNVLLSQATTQLGVDAATVLLFKPHIQTLECAAHRGFRSTAIARRQVRLGEGYAGRAVLEGRTIEIRDLRPVLSVAEGLEIDQNLQSPISNQRRSSPTMVRRSSPRARSKESWRSSTVPPSTPTRSGWIF